MLRDELVNAQKRPNYVSQICQAFEGGNRRRVLQQNPQGLDDFIANVFKTIGLSPAMQVAVSYALTHSQFRTYSVSGLKTLKLALPNVVPSGSVAEIREEILSGVVKLILSVEVSSSLAYQTKSEEHEWLEVTMYDNVVFQSFLLYTYAYVYLSSVDKLTRFSLFYSSPENKCYH